MIADRLVAPGAPLLVRHAEQLDLFLHPADTRAQDDAPRRQMIERREHLGGEDGMTVGKNEHGRAEADALGHAGDEPERDQRLQKLVVGASGNRRSGCRDSATRSRTE